MEIKVKEKVVSPRENEKVKVTEKVRARVKVRGNLTKIMFGIMINPKGKAKEKGIRHILCRRRTPIILTTGTRILTHLHKC